MNDARHREIELLVPWYAAASLPAEEEARVTAHLETCGVCRELLGQARENVELAEAGSVSDHMAHVSPRLLTEYAEESDRLDDETQAWIAARLHECADCRSAYERLLDVELSLAKAAQTSATARTESRARAAGRSESFLATIWSALTSSVLRPVPALAYLLLLVGLAFPALRSVIAPTFDPAPDTLLTPVLLTVEGSRAVRGEVDALPPLEVTLPGDRSRPLLLRLALGLPVATLGELAPSCRVELTAGDTLLSSETRPTAGLQEESGRATLYVLVESGQLDPAVAHEIAVRAVKPGSAVDGRTIFRREIAFSP